MEVLVEEVEKLITLRVVQQLQDKEMLAVLLLQTVRGEVVAEAVPVMLAAQVKQMETAETAHLLTILGQLQPVQELMAIDMLVAAVAEYTILVLVILLVASEEVEKVNLETEEQDQMEPQTVEAVAVAEAVGLRQELEVLVDLVFA